MDRKARILVLGLGNPILTDDGVGIHAVRRASRFFRHPKVTYQESSLASFGLLDIITGYEKLILVDSMTTDKCRPGTIKILGIQDIAAEFRMRNFHSLSIAGILAIADEMGIPRPEDTVIFAVEAEDCSTFSEVCTPAVQAATLKVAEMILEQVKRWIKGESNARSRNRPQSH